jgi:uncharacterized Zn-binding protein involved in type VI secretion
MPVTIHVNGAANSLVHKGSNGMAIATIPDVCKTPSPGGPVPIPYPNIAMSNSLAKGTKTVKVDGKKMAAVKGSEFSRSNGDEAGTAGGVKSSTNMKEATWILYSFDVKLDGKNACRLADKMQMNHGNTVCLGGTLQEPVSLTPTAKKVADCLCNSFCNELKRGFDKTKTSRGTYKYTKKASMPKRKNWSYDLEQKLIDKPPACLTAQTHIRKRYGKTTPDAVLGSGKKPNQCFDFKFPGDSWRGNQKYRQKKLAGNKEPQEISAKTCKCK